MHDYTFDPLRAPAVRAGPWVLSFAMANALLAGLVLLMGPLVNSAGQHRDSLTRDWDFELTSDLLPNPVAAAPVSAPVPAVPPTPDTPAAAPLEPAPDLVSTPPPIVAKPVPDEKPVEAPPERPIDDGVPLAYNNQDNPDEPRPPNARFAGVENSPARSSHPTPGSHDPVPVQPDGVASQVLALGQAGTPGAAHKGITIPQGPEAGAPEVTPPVTATAPVATATTDTPPVKGAVTPGSGAAGDPQGTAATAGTKPAVNPQAPAPPATGAVPAVPETVDPQGEGNALLPSTVGAPAVQAVPDAAAGGPVAIAGANPGDPKKGVDGLGETGVGAGTTGSGTAPSSAATTAAEALAAERAALAALKAADQAKPGAAAVAAPKVTEVAPTIGDAQAVSKTPFWNVRLNTENAGPDAFETYKEPVAKYLKEFRTILEQNFYREVSLPRTYRFREGEFADLEMTFHADGKIDTVRLVPESGSKYFTAEMEAICKAAIVRSSPYKTFTEELRKERREFKLVVRFHF